jgi:hypothetical protein
MGFLKNLFTKPKQCYGSLPPNFDFEAGYKRLVGQLAVMNHNLIAATESIILARELTTTMLSDAKEIQIEKIEGPMDGEIDGGFIISVEAAQAFEMARNTWGMVLDHIHESMGEIAYSELKMRVESGQYRPEQATMLKGILTQMEQRRAPKMGKEVRV